MYARINKDANSPEFFLLKNAAGDSIIYYGDKDEAGIAQRLRTIEFIPYYGKRHYLELNENGSLSSLYTEDGVTIDFEWESQTTAVVNAKSEQDHVFISTLVDFSNKAQSKSVKNSSKNNCKPRSGKLSMQIYPDNGQYLEQLNKRSGIDPDDLQRYQLFQLWIHQCDANFDAKNYLILRNAKDNSYIGKLMDGVRYIKGLYNYAIPTSSYPTEAPHEKICGSIDNCLSVAEQILSGALADSQALILALNTAAMSTGAGMIPTIIADAIVFSGVGADIALQYFLSKGGISNALKKGSFTTDWYYKEYIYDNLKVIPVAYTQGTTVAGDACILKPTDKEYFASIELAGNPVINSFSLSPSHPGSGQGYYATAEYNCIPENSTITLSIIGTDGYSDSISGKISGSGSAVLRVPGAGTGVQDHCTAVINMPFGESLVLDASLVFGY